MRVHATLLALSGLLQIAQIIYGSELRSLHSGPLRVVGGRLNSNTRVIVRKKVAPRRNFIAQCCGVGHGCSQPSKKKRTTSPARKRTTLSSEAKKRSTQFSASDFSTPEKEYQEDPSESPTESSADEGLELTQENLLPGEIIEESTSGPGTVSYITDVPSAQNSDDSGTLPDLTTQHLNLRSKTAAPMQPVRNVQGSQFESSAAIAGSNKPILQPTASLPDSGVPVLSQTSPKTPMPGTMLGSPLRASTSFAPQNIGAVSTQSTTFSTTLSSYIKSGSVVSQMNEPITSVAPGAIQTQNGFQNTGASSIIDTPNGATVPVLGQNIALNKPTAQTSKPNAPPAFKTSTLNAVTVTNTDLTSLVNIAQTNAQNIQSSSVQTNIPNSKQTNSQNPPTYAQTSTAILPDVQPNGPSVPTVSQANTIINMQNNAQSNQPIENVIVPSSDAITSTNNPNPGSPILSGTQKLSTVSYAQTIAELTFSTKVVSEVYISTGSLIDAPTNSVSNDLSAGVKLTDLPTVSGSGQMSETTTVANNPQQSNTKAQSSSVPEVSNANIGNINNLPSTVTTDSASVTTPVTIANANPVSEVSTVGTTTTVLSKAGSVASVSVVTSTSTAITQPSEITATSKSEIKTTNSFNPGTTVSEGFVSQASGAESSSKAPVSTTVSVNSVAASSVSSASSALSSATTKANNPASTSVITNLDSVTATSANTPTSNIVTTTLANSAVSTTVTTKAANIPASISVTLSYSATSSSVTTSVANTPASTSVTTTASNFAASTSVSTGAANSPASSSATTAVATTPAPTSVTPKATPASNIVISTTSTAQPTTTLAPEYCTCLPSCSCVQLNNSLLQMDGTMNSAAAMLQGDWSLACGTNVTSGGTTLAPAIAATVNVTNVCCSICIRGTNITKLVRRRRALPIGGSFGSFATPTLATMPPAKNGAAAAASVTTTVQGPTYLNTMTRCTMNMLNVRLTKTATLTDLIYDIAARSGNCGVFTDSNYTATVRNVKCSTRLKTSSSAGNAVDDACQYVQSTQNCDQNMNVNSDDTTRYTNCTVTRGLPTAGSASCPADDLHMCNMPSSVNCKPSCFNWPAGKCVQKSSLFDSRGLLINPTQYGKWISTCAGSIHLIGTVANKMDVNASRQLCCDLGMDLSVFETNAELTCLINTGVSEYAANSNSLAGSYFLSGAAYNCHPNPNPGSYFLWCPTNGSRPFPTLPDQVFSAGQPNNKPGTNNWGQYCLGLSFKPPGSISNGINDINCGEDLSPPICEITGPSSPALLTKYGLPASGR